MDGKILALEAYKDQLEINDHLRIIYALQIDKLEKKNKIMREALENIVKHFKLLGGRISEFSTTYTIAQEALDRCKDN